MEAGAERIETLPGPLESVILSDRDPMDLPGPGERVYFVRERENRRDPNAVRVTNADGLSAGYLPRRITSWIAPLLDCQAVNIEGVIADRRSVRSSRIPLDLHLHLTGRGNDLMRSHPDPATLAGAWHEVVRNAYTMAGGWSRPTVIRGVHDLILGAHGRGLLPESKMLLALMPVRAAIAKKQAGSDAALRLRAALDGLVIGEARHHRNLTVFPLFLNSDHTAAYLLLEEALAAGLAKVEEVSDAGSVPELLVRNRSDKPVLIPEGEVLTGAKQNRVVNITIMVAAQSDLVIPVSCVEHGRWRHNAPGFSSTHYAPPEMRGGKSRSVNRQRSQRGTAQSNQGKVWEDVAESLSRMEVDSPTDSLTEGMDRTRERRHGYRQHLRLPEGASGALAATGDRVLAVDLFDAPAPMGKLWDRIADAYFFQAAMSPGEVSESPRNVAEAFVRDIAERATPADKSIGAGVEFVIDTDTASGTALWYGESLCHLSACFAE